MRPRRHYMIPDVQVRPGDAVDHLDWIARDIVRRKPDVIVCIGDFWDFPSLSSYAPAGGLEKEGARIQADIEAGEAAMKRLTDPIHEEIARLKRRKQRHWNPRMVFCEGNHEARIARLPKEDARFLGVVGTHLCRVEAFGWERVPFEQPICIDDVWYCHYWKTALSPRPISGSIDNRLNKLGFSFVAGHEQGRKHGNRDLPNGRTIHGIVAGSCYLGTEGYRGPQGKNEWRGIVVLNDVRNGGDFEDMFVTLRHLCRKNTGEELQDYMAQRYPKRDWSHLA